MMRSDRHTEKDVPALANPIPFPRCERVETPRSREGERALRAINHVSRKLEDLARRLNCLGFFDETDPDHPRAA